MAAAPKHRQKIVRSAAVLFRRQGYAASGTSQILALSGAPRGSLYHYFPAGKEQIAAAAVDYAGDLVSGSLAALIERESSPADALREYGKLLAGWLTESGYRDGCPITTTLLELSPASESVTAAGSRVLHDWVGLLQRALEESAVPPDRARSLATLAVASLEGALVLARVDQDTTALLDVVAQLAELFEAASRGLPCPSVPAAEH
jgi:TetR/AcrR family transcriptional repressor of lmrAB and yxaGH operons